MLSLQDCLLLCCPSTCVSYPQAVNPTTHSLSSVNLLKLLTELRKTLVIFYEEYYKSTAEQVRYERTLPYLSQPCHCIGMAANRLRREAQQTLCLWSS